MKVLGSEFSFIKLSQDVTHFTTGDVFGVGAQKNRSVDTYTNKTDNDFRISQLLDSNVRLVLGHGVV
jgi:hypothetical protein